MKNLRWLIVEDALRDRKGHWFEYLSTFARELRSLGDAVTILADHSAENFLREQLAVEPVLPDSIWHRMGDGAGPLRRYARVPWHAWATRQALKAYLAGGKQYDLIFVPTVLVHHLLGWTWLIKRVLQAEQGKVLLFFPNTPIWLDAQSGRPIWQTAPTAKLFCKLIQSLGMEVKQGRVILGVETHPMREALTQLTGVPFTYFPHPVQEPAGLHREDGTQASVLTMGSYGSARHEKGCDVLVPAVEEFCRRHPEAQVKFVLQSVEGDPQLWARLKENPRVQLIPQYFADGEYARQLRATDVLLLPYRRSSYALRVSRVVIEAMVQGLPVVTTRGTTLENQAAEFGAAVYGEDENVASFVQAIEAAAGQAESLKVLAQRQRTRAAAHFSVKEFRAIVQQMAAAH